jgi:phosphomannomutase
LTLIKSISGIRGTIGGREGDNLSPPDIMRFTTAYSTLLKKKYNRPLVVIGRDGRLSGEAVSMLVASTLSFCGVDVIDCGLSTTPSVEMAVTRKKASGGIICTASHNPKDWNALKFLDHNGEFISGKMGEELVKMTEEVQFTYATVDRLGRISSYEHSIEDHISDVLKLDTIDRELLRSLNWKVTVDAINSTGAIAIPMLLDQLGIECDLINGDNFGDFAHEAEPLPKNLSELSKRVASSDSVLGIAVDPDVDRLVLICEDGSPFGEEYTLVAVADYYLKTKGPGPTVSNLSSTLALKDISKRYDAPHYFSAVGERHVVDVMKEKNALIGGEGNGGIILPDLHYGRDAVAGLAVFLTLLARSGKKATELKSSFPEYHMSKDKIQLAEGFDPDEILEQLESHYSDEEKDRTDGLKVYFKNAWIHIRKSNTEPILRIYAEAKTPGELNRLNTGLKQIIESFMK